MGGTAEAPIKQPQTLIEYGRSKSEDFQILKETIS
jgi:hypothetical protein